MSANPFGQVGRVIQGYFPGGRPSIPRASSLPDARPPGVPQSPAHPIQAPSLVATARPPGRPAAVQPMPARTRPETAPARLVPQGVDRSRPPAPTPTGKMPAPVLPTRPAAVQPRMDHAFRLPPTVALKPSALGQRLPEGVRSRMEALFRADFSDVRVHVGSEASSIGALAFATGSDLYFAPGQYNLHAPHGHRLLGHELAHVVQQRSGRVRNPLGPETAVVLDPALEAEAERMGMRAAASIGAAAALVSRDPLQAAGAPIGRPGPITGGLAPRPPVGHGAILPARDPARTHPAPVIPANAPAGSIRRRQASAPLPRPTPPGVVQRQPELSSYAVKARGTDDVTLVPRSLVDTEKIGDQTYVRLYQTVYAPREGTSTWKDVQEGPHGSVKIIGKGDAWINAGQPLRAFHYVRTYTSQGVGRRAEATAAFHRGETTYMNMTFTNVDQIRRMHGQPIVRTFLVPWDVYEEVTSQAIAESQKATLGATYALSVDKSTSPDQYLIRAADVAKLRQHARPGSIISYVPDAHLGEYTEPAHGTVRPLSELRKKMGMPADDRLLAPMEGNEVASPETQAARAKELAELYELSFFVEKPEDVPRYQRRLARAGFGDQHRILADIRREYDQHRRRLEELTWKYLGRATWPSDKAERTRIREEVGRAATFSLIPSIVKENYYEATARMHGQTVNDKGQPLSPWTLRQNFPVVVLDPPAPTVVGVSDADKVHLRKYFDKHASVNAERFTNEVVASANDALRDKEAEALANIKSYLFKLAAAKLKT